MATFEGIEASIWVKMPSGLGMVLCPYRLVLLIYATTWGAHGVHRVWTHSQPAWRLVDAAKSAGAKTNGLVVDTAGRQRMCLGG